MSLAVRGECVSCKFVSQCKETSVQRVLDDYTCPRYEGVVETEYLARMETRRVFGDRMLAEALCIAPDEDVPRGEQLESNQSQ